MKGAELGERLRDGDLTAAPAVLNLVENRKARDEVAALLHAVEPAQLGGEAPAHIVGVTGPPGAGKSTLLSELVRAWRAAGRTVAVLAVDPSSRALRFSTRLSTAGAAVRSPSRNRSPSSAPFTRPTRRRRCAPRRASRRRA